MDGVPWSEAAPQNPTALLRAPLARPLLRFGDFVCRHLVCDRIAIADSGAAARIGRREARGSNIEPHIRADVVWCSARRFALGIGKPEIVLGLGVAFVGGALKPPRRF